MMNKAFEVIEAHHLFGLPYEDIDVVVHPQSFVHSFVEFTDGVVKAEVGEPDMRKPIQYAITAPARVDTEHPPFAPAGLTLEFEAPDPAAFRPGPGDVVDVGSISLIDLPGADAIAAAFNALSKPNSTTWVLEGDIKGCFDNIGHHGLMQRIRRRINDAKVNRLVLAFLKAGVIMLPASFTNSRGISFSALATSAREMVPVSQVYGSSETRSRVTIKPLRPAAVAGMVLIVGAASAVVLELGSALSHGAVVAREVGVPMVVNLDGATRILREGDEITVDGRRGYVWVHP